MALGCHDQKSFHTIVLYRAGRSDTGVGTSDTPTLSEVDLDVGVECRKSGVKSVASRGVGSPVLSSDTSTLFDIEKYMFYGLFISFPPPLCENSPIR